MDPQRVASEFAAVKLGDARLERRLRHTATVLANKPATGFPRVLTPAELEGYYRLVNNEQVSWEALLAAHVQATSLRAVTMPRVVVAEDTTDFRFRDEVEREGLGPMDNGGQGFYAHFALAVTGPLQPLGVVGLEPWVRTATPPGTAKARQRDRYLAADKESLRWARMVDTVERELAGSPLIVHVMDREADDYDLLAALVTGGRHFVVRSATDRRLAGPGLGGKLRAFVRRLEIAGERTAKLAGRPVTGRPAKERKKYHPRKPRLAHLTIGSERVCLRRPDRAATELPPELEVNVVHVTEPEPPADCQPVDWLLFTSEPVDTEEQILQVIDDYRLRWLIEEYFKALKSGCAFERRQHETKDALLNALAIFIPIAWSLLQLRALSRSPAHADTPASRVLTVTQLQALHAKSRGRVSLTPTIREAMLGIALYFGGHIKNNGEPGWQVLGRGYEDLLMAEAGWLLATAARGEM